MGPVAYKLELPEHSRIHPVFHCSLLKPLVGSTESVKVETLPAGAVDNQPLTTPLAILGQKMVPTDQGLTRMVLVQWQGLHPDETSWEEWEGLKEQYHLEDKVLIEDRGNVTNSNFKHQVTRPKRRSNIPGHLKDYELQA